MIFLVPSTVNWNSPGVCSTEFMYSVWHLIVCICLHLRLTLKVAAGVSSSGYSRHLVQSILVGSNPSGVFRQLGHLKFVERLVFKQFAWNLWPHVKAWVWMLFVKGFWHIVHEAEAVCWVWFVSMASSWSVALMIDTWSPFVALMTSSSLIAVK